MLEAVYNKTDMVGCLNELCVTQWPSYCTWYNGETGYSSGICRYILWWGFTFFSTNV